MDHMRNSGTKPSSVILSQKKLFSKVEKRCSKRAKYAKAKRGRVINL